MNAQDTKLTSFPKGTRFNVVTPIQRKEKTIWRDLGSAFVMEDGSLQVVLDVAPLDGRMQIRIPLTKPNDS
jgi:hypothetical protein